MTNYTKKYRTKISKSAAEVSVYATTYCTRISRYQNILIAINNAIIIDK